MGQGVSGGIPVEDLIMQPLSADAQLFKSKQDDTLGYIVARRDSPFVRFCLLAESIVKTHDALVATYIPRDEVPRTHHDRQDPIDAFDVFGESSDDDTNSHKPVYDEESGAGAPRGVRNSTGIHTEGSHAIEQHGAELNNHGMRHRGTSPTSPSPPPSGQRRLPVGASVDEHSILVDAGASPPPRRAFRQAPTSVIPGDVERSTLVKKMPPAYETPDEYCVVSRIVLWNAYIVYSSIRSVDVGLIRAIDNGEIDLCVQPSTSNWNAEADATATATATQQAAETTRRKINKWRVGYADRIMTYNTAVDVFIAKSTGYLVHAKERGDEDAGSLLGLIHALNHYKALTIPEPAQGKDDS